MSTAACVDIIVADNTLRFIVESEGVRYHSNPVVAGTNEFIELIRKLIGKPIDKEILTFMPIQEIVNRMHGADLDSVAIKTPDFHPILSDAELGFDKPASREMLTNFAVRNFIEMTSHQKKVIEEFCSQYVTVDIKEAIEKADESSEKNETNFTSIAYLRRFLKKVEDENKRIREEREIEERDYRARIKEKQMMEAELPAMLEYNKTHPPLLQGYPKRIAMIRAGVFMIIYDYASNNGINPQDVDEWYYMSQILDTYDEEGIENRLKEIQNAGIGITSLKQILPEQSIVPPMTHQAPNHCT